MRHYWSAKLNQIVRDIAWFLYSEKGISSNIHDQNTHALKLPWKVLFLEQELLKVGRSSQRPVLFIVHGKVFNSPSVLI